MFAGGVYEQISIVKNVGADDWTTKVAVIASNDFNNFFKNGECKDGKVAYIIIRNIKRECADMGGGWNLTPGDEDWIDCHLDVCRGNIAFRRLTNRYILVTIETGHSADFCCQALLQLIVSVHIAQGIYIQKILLSRNIAKLLKINIFGYIQVSLDAGNIVMKLIESLVVINKDEKNLLT